MVLSHAVLFPHAMMPLFIFEPRYREMLNYALEQQRMFCIGVPLPHVEEVVGPEDLFPIAGLGLVRACVGREDGTSHLILQGVARVRLSDWLQDEPFRIASLEELPSAPLVDLGEAEELSHLLLDAAETAPGAEGAPRATLNAQMRQITDPAILADVVAHTYIHDPWRRQALLEETDVVCRLRTVLAYLREDQ